MAQAAEALPEGYMPFRVRFLAWWHGLEPDALVKQPVPAKKLSPESIRIDREPTAEELLAARLALLQRVWGDGCLEPGGAEYTRYLIKPLVPSPDKSLLDLAAGMCGGVNSVADEYGLWVDAMEPDPDLLAAAQAFCERLGLEKKIKLSGYDPEKLTLPKKKYDCILARERFYLFPDKLEVLRAVCGAFKPGGQLLFTDLALADRGKENEAVAHWREALPAAPSLWTMEEYQECLAELKFDVRIFADDTNAWRAQIVRGWSKFVGDLTSEVLDRVFVDALMIEAELWHDQVQALESGQLRFVRVHAIYHGNASRAMSGA